MSRARRSLKQLTTPAVRAMWVEFAQTRCPRLRNRLVEAYLPLVSYFAERVHARLPVSVDIGDLLSAGAIGLMGAVGAYDPARPVKFESFCTRRIYGAIIDELRAMDWVPRMVRERAAKLDRAMTVLTAELGREPTRDELQAFLKVTPAAFNLIDRDGRPRAKLSLSNEVCNSDEEAGGSSVEQSCMIVQTTEADPAVTVAARDARAEIVADLSSAESDVVVKLYWKGLKQDETARTRGQSPSYVSIIHKQAMQRLRASRSYEETRALLVA
ncbi:MAG TPA: sigma-70 family RNA polymerase sigma factor [Tepidisphaeraceae bacterium]|nr:sigma-70 family RNA polymerase sigma factor [Tepidisphaeraceae bacterium]